MRHRTTPSILLALALLLGLGALTACGGGGGGGPEVLTQPAVSPSPWAVGVGSDGTDIPSRVAKLAGGECAVVGGFDGSGMVGATQLDTNGETDILAAAWSAAGDPLWARAFGGTDPDFGMGLDCVPDGAVLVTGTNLAEITLAGTPLLSAGDYDAWVTRHAADGSAP